MARLKHVVSAALVIFAIARPNPALSAVQDIDQLVADRLRSRFEVPVADQSLAVNDEKVMAVRALQAFYGARVYRPVYAGAEGRRQASMMLRQIRGVVDDGLRPEDYHAGAIAKILNEIRNRPVVDPGVLTDLELLLTDGILLAGSHLLMGRVNPETFDPEWVANRRGANLADLLGRAIENDSLDQWLESLRPRDPGYGQLRAARRYFAALVGQRWDSVALGGSDAVGVDQESMVRERLRRLGQGSAPANLDDAVREFQVRYGLPASARLDTATVNALNVSPAERLEQIDLNLERWRWLPESLGERHIIVNIAAFEMKVVDRGTVPLRMNVVVGRDYRRTPVFSGSMTYLVLSPFWHVPLSIAVRDKLPLIRRNPNYLRDQQYKVFAGWGAETEEINPSNIDWTQVTASDFPYRLRQDPGPQNALGDVKFMFPNKFNVYLHDSPQRELFGETERAFSSGCIRLERPLALAEYLLADTGNWSGDEIRQTVSRRKETTIRLSRAIPVHLLYWTAWIGDDGAVHFRRDIYGRDGRLRGAWTVGSPS